MLQRGNREKSGGFQKPRFECAHREKIGRESTSGVLHLGSGKVSRPVTGLANQGFRTRQPDGNAIAPGTTTVQIHFRLPLALSSAYCNSQHIILLSIYLRSTKFCHIIRTPRVPWRRQKGNRFPSRRGTTPYTND